MSSNRGLLIASSVLVAVALVLGACGTPAPPAAEPPEPVETPAAKETPEAPAATAEPAPPAEKKVLTIATSAGATAMSVGESYGAGPAEMMMAEMYSHLVFRNHDGEIVPELATSWELLDDTTWQFKLREGVKFHNGEDFTADDVKYSFDLALEPERGWVTLTTYELLDSVEVVDDYTVKLHTSAPFPDLPFFLGQFLILPDQFTQEVGYEGLVEEPNGTGPFKFVGFVPGDYLKLEAFDDYWDGRVSIDEVVWRLIPEAATRVAALQAGEVDIAAQVPMDLIPVVEDDPNLSVDYAYELMCLQLWMDTMTDSPCADKRVRQAIDCGIDKKAIWEGLMAPVGRLNGQVLTPDVFGYNPDIEQTPYDPDKARQLLAEAGYADGLDLEIQTVVGKYLVDRDACIVIADQLAEIGINLTVNVVEPASFLDYLSHNDKRCDMIYLGWYSYGNPSQALQWFATQTPWHKWENEEYSDLFLAAKSSLDEEERLDMYHRMAEIVKEEAPTVPLYQQAAPYGVNNAVTNWRPHPGQQIYLVGVDLER